MWAIAKDEMSQRDKPLVKILLGTSDSNIPFESLR